MSDFQIVLAIAAIPSAALVGLAVYGFVSSQYRHRGYEPIIDYDEMQRELDAEFAPLSIDTAARLSA